jgi:hypothetical protein
MEIGSRIASEIAAAIFAPFSGRNAMISLAPLSVLVGIGMLWVFRRTSNPDAIGKAKARMMAHLYEMRLFPDEPVLIWKAQWGLLTANARYLAMMLLPAIMMSIPMVLLFSEMECFYGYRPLEPGREGVLTVQLKTASDGAAPVVRAPSGIAVESEGVRLDEGRQISWRIRATRPVSGNFQIVFPQETVEKSIEAGAGPRYLSERRVSSIGDMVWHPSESLLPPGIVDWVEVRYPSAGVAAWGLELPWLAWLIGFSMVTALALKRRFKVTF